MTDAGSNSAPTIAETIGVSQGTVRNRIDSLEGDRIIEGYRAHVNFERAGRRNFHALAVNRDTDDLRRIGTTLSEEGIEIDFVSCESEVVEVTVESEAPIAKMDVSEAVGSGILDEEPLVISIRRDTEILTPHGDTTLQPDDLVTVFSCDGVTDATRRAFSGSSDEGP